MIEIGKNFLKAVAQASQTARQQKTQAKTLAQQAQEQADALQQAYEEKMEYLFRSSAEKTHLAYENARRQLAVLQAQRAAKSIAGDSASVVDEKQTAALQQSLAQQQTQQNLQNTAAQQTHIFEQQLSALRQAIKRFGKKAHQKHRLGSLGQAILSLFQ